MSDELKPCPFDGEKACAVQMAGGYWIVECRICSAKTGHWGTEQHAIAAWNRRAGETG